MFSNSKMSENDPRGVVSIFQISLKFKKSKISDGGGSQAYFGKTQKVSRFLIMMPPLSIPLAHVGTGNSQKLDGTENFIKTCCAVIIK